MIFLRTIKHMEKVMQKGSTYPEDGVSISSDYTLYLNGENNASQIPSNRGYSIHASGSVYDLNHLIHQSTPASFEGDADY